MKLVKIIFTVVDFFVDTLDAWLCRYERKLQAKEMNKKAWNDIDFVEPPDQQLKLF